METSTCTSCGVEVSRGDWPFCPHGSALGVKSGEWGDTDKILVFRKPDGTLSYPMHNSKPTPAGCERMEIKSMAALRRFERQNNVVSHVGSYDRNGRGLDDKFKGERF